MKTKRSKTFKIDQDCCKHNSGTNIYDIGWIILPCFKVAICRDCETAVSLNCKFMEVIFEHIFEPLWNGRIHLFEKYPHGFIRIGNRLCQTDGGDSNG